MNSTYQDRFDKEMQENLQLQEMIISAISKGLDGEEKEQLLRQIMARGMQLSANHQEITSCIMSALRVIMSKVLQEKLLTDPAFIELTETLYVDAMKEVFGGDNRQKIVEHIANSIRAGFDR